MKKILTILLAISMLLGQNTHVFAEKVDIDKIESDRKTRGSDNNMDSDTSKASEMGKDNERVNLISQNRDTAEEIQHTELSNANEDENINKETTDYDNNNSSSSNGVTLKVEWNNPVLGEPTTFYVSATGGSGSYLFRMDAPSYSNPNEREYESVADPSRGEWTSYTSACTSHGYEFTMTASGTYNFRFYVMDRTAGVYYLRVSTNIQVSDANYPSVNSIVNSAITQCNNETDGSDYQKALWLHDWLLDQLDYDNLLKWSSSESALTRRKGTCQAYESAYSKLLTAAGIENTETRDTYDGHTWNAVKIDGQWYQVDCTWDDSNDNWYDFDQRHLYFCITDELMAIAHPGHSKIYTVDGYGTRSTSLEDNFFVKKGEASRWAENYKERIQSQLDVKKTEFTIDADNASYPSSISKIQNGIIAYALNQNKWETGNQSVVLQVTSEPTKLKFEATYSALDPKDDNNQSEMDKLAELNIGALEDGTYVIRSAVNNKYVLDVYGGSSANEANVQIYAENGSKAQNWIIKHDEKGYITVTNEGSKKVLDVKDRSTKNGANVQQHASNLTQSQKWIAIKQTDGSVEFVSALDKNKCIDLNGAQAKDSSNIQVYESNNSKAQRWVLTKPLTIDDIANIHKGDIEDGIYVIRSMVNRKFVLDVYGGSSANEANVQVYTRNSSKAQSWVIRHDEKGYITIINEGSKRALDIKGGSTKDGTNIQQYVSNLTKAQKWIAIKQTDGSVEFVSALDKNKCIDLNGALAKNSSNIQIYESNGSKAQRWVLTKELTIDDIAKAHKGDIEDGTYVIRSAVNKKFVLDVYDSSLANEANVQIYRENGSKAQNWVIKHDKKGYIIITNEASQKVLDVKGGSTKDGANIQQYTSNLTKAQKWIAIRYTDGSIEIISGLDEDKCIDLYGAQVQNSSNVQIYEKNDSKAQRWYLTR